MSLVVVTGASGFIGRQVLPLLLAGQKPVRALTRIPVERIADKAGLEWVTGDIRDPGVWEKLLEPGCTVLHLAYSQHASLDDATQAARTMVSSCMDAGAARLVHCSTISVFGRTAGGLIDEATACSPTDAYGRQKLAIEEAIRETVKGRIELATLRPAAVFGKGGQALRSLCNSLEKRHRLINYARSSLFGHRKMHLVPVETVAAAAAFLCNEPRRLADEVFIVSEDLDPLNNFRSVEQLLMRKLKVPDYTLPLVPLPQVVLRALLQWRGRSEIHPDCVYLPTKLQSRGFVAPVTLAAALNAFDAGVPGQAERALQ